MIDIIRKIAPEDIYLTAFADLTGIIPPKFCGTPFAVSIARRLDDAIVDAVADGPTMEYHDLYHAVNAELAGTARDIAAALSESGARVIVIEPTVSDIRIDADMRQNLRHDFSHKMAATVSGLGWIGKTDLLVTEKFGPRVRLATVLTDMPLAPLGIPVRESRCGSCRKCVDACPAGAANGTVWKAGMDRGEFYDAFRCREKCRELSKARLDREISLCGICVSVCPFGKKTSRGNSAGL